MAEKKRTQSNKGNSAARRKGDSAGKKSQAATRAQAAQRQEDPSPIPTTIIAGIVMGAAALVLLAALFNMNGAIFTLLGDILDLRTWSSQAQLVMGTLLLMTPTVFFTFQRLFDWSERTRLYIADWFSAKWNKLFHRKRAAAN